MNYSIFVLIFIFGFVVGKPIDTIIPNESKNNVEDKRFVSQQFPDQFRLFSSNVAIKSNADTSIQHLRIKRQFPGMEYFPPPYMQQPYIQQPYMPFMMPQSFPTFLTISNQKQKYMNGFFGNMGKSSNFFMTLGR